MGKMLKLSSILVVISLLALPLAACMGQATILIVRIDTPQDGITVTASPVTVSGTSNMAATVKINDVLLPGKVTKFSTSVTLTEGENVINVVATAGKQKVTKTLTVTYTPAK